MQYFMSSNFCRPNLIFASILAALFAIQQKDLQFKEFFS